MSTGVVKEMAMNVFAVKLSIKTAVLKDEMHNNLIDLELNAFLIEKMR